MEITVEKKINEILQFIDSDSIDQPIIEISSQHQTEEIDAILGKNKFLYYKRPNEANILLIHKKRGVYIIKMYWINKFLFNK